MTGKVSLDKEYPFRSQIFQQINGINTNSKKRWTGREKSKALDLRTWIMTNEYNY
jgi:hypothetical protein